MYPREQQPKHLSGSMAQSSGSPPHSRRSSSTPRGSHSTPRESVTFPQMTQPCPMHCDVMPPPPPDPNCPPGLEYLSSLDELIIHQEREALDVFTSIDTTNRYRVCNRVGQRLWYCGQVCCGPKRPFIIYVTDNTGEVIMRVDRDFKTCACCTCCACCDCCQKIIMVEAPLGIAIGYVRQKCSCCVPKFEVLDAELNPVFIIEGPTKRRVCCSVVCEIFHVSDTKLMIGKITKKTETLLEEMFTQSDVVGIQFPLDLDVNMKATLFGAIFLIDFMYFDDREARR